MKGYIYCYSYRYDNGEIKYYIGQTININRRKREHLKSKEIDHFHCSIRKYGMDNFNFEILEELEFNTYEVLKSNLNEREIFYINKYDSFKNGYNSTIGGSNIKKFYLSEDIKQKLSISKKERRKEISEKMLEFWEKNKDKMIQLFNDPERLKKISLSMKKLWKNNEYRNKVLSSRKSVQSSENYKRKQSESGKKAWENNEDRRNRTSKALLKYNKNPKVRETKSKVQKEKWKDSEYRTNISNKISEKWKNDPEYRLKCTSKTGAANSNARKVKITNIITNEVKIFETVTECCSFLGINITKIYKYYGKIFKNLYKVEKCND